MSRLYHIDYHYNSAHIADCTATFFYVWSEDDIFKSTRIGVLNEDINPIPVSSADNVVKNPINAFLSETEDDLIVPVARSVPEQEVLKYMRTYALLNDLPINQGE